MLAISAPAASSAPELAPQPDSWAAQRCRYWEKQALSMVRNTLCHAVITEEQRAAAERQFTQAAGEQGFVGKMIAWNRAVREYIRAVSAGERAAKLNPQGEAVAQVPQLRLARQQRPGTVARFQGLRHRRQLAKPTEPRGEGVVLPMWEPARELEQLPQNLHWSGSREIPAIGQTVEVSRYGRKVGGQLDGYCHVEGLMGVLGGFDKLHCRMKKAVRSQCVFGRELAA